MRRRETCWSGVSAARGVVGEKVGEAEMTGVHRWARWGRARIMWSSSPRVLGGQWGAEAELVGEVPAGGLGKVLVGRERAVLTL